MVLLRHAHLHYTHTLVCRLFLLRRWRGSFLLLLWIFGVDSTFVVTLVSPRPALFLFLDGVRGGSVNVGSSSSTSFLGCCVSFSFSSVGFSGSDTGVGTGAGLAFPLLTTSVYTCLAVSFTGVCTSGVAHFTGTPGLFAKLWHVAIRCPGCWQI